jgi:hypothetical protein
MLIQASPHFQCQWNRATLCFFIMASPCITSGKEHNVKNENLNVVVIDNKSGGACLFELLKLLLVGKLKSQIRSCEANSKSQTKTITKLATGLMAEAPYPHPSYPNKVSL